MKRLKNIFNTVLLPTTLLSVPLTIVSCSNGKTYNLALISDAPDAFKFEDKEPVMQKDKVFNINVIQNQTEETYFIENVIVSSATKVLVQNVDYVASCYKNETCVAISILKPNEDLFIRIISNKSKHVAPLYDTPATMYPNEVPTRQMVMKYYDLDSPIDGTYNCSIYSISTDKIRKNDLSIGSLEYDEKYKIFHAPLTVNLFFKLTEDLDFNITLKLTFDSTKEDGTISSNIRFVDMPIHFTKDQYVPFSKIGEEPYLVTDDTVTIPFLYKQNIGDWYPVSNKIYGDNVTFILNNESTNEETYIDFHNQSFEIDKENKFNVVLDAMNLDQDTEYTLTINFNYFISVYDMYEGTVSGIKIKKSST